MPSAPITSFVPQTQVFGVGGDVPIDTAGLDLASLVLLVSLKRHEQLEGGVVQQMKDIQDKNAILAKYREIINKIKNMNIKDKKGEQQLTEEQAEELAKIAKREYPQFFKDLIGTFKHDPDKRTWTVELLQDGAIEKSLNIIQTEIEKFSGNSQVEMIKLQATMTKANQMMDFASSFVHKADEVQKGIIRNMA